MVAVQVTSCVQWDQPSLPHMLELDDSGSEIFVESEQDRVMPSRSSLLTGSHPFPASRCHGRESCSTS